jgi:tetratricopeptide (TPR) repeat protein
MRDYLKKDKWPPVIFLAAFLFRLIYILQSRSNPSFYYPTVDELWHLNWAREILTGPFWGSEAYFRGPLYPYLLAFIWKISGGSILWARIIQLIIPSISAVIVYLLGAKTFNRKIGVFAGLGFAAYGTMIFYDGMFMIEALAIMLNLLATYFLSEVRPEQKPIKYLWPGLILGLSAITRPNILLFVPPLLLWIYVVSEKKSDIKRRILFPVVFAVGLIVPIFGVTLRNYFITEEPILISSQGGVNFYIGNNPDAEGLTMMMPEVRLDESLPWNQFTAATRAAAEKEAGKKLKPGEESSFWTRKALNFIWNNPGDFIYLTFKKFVYFCLGFENSDNQDIYYSRNYSGLLALLLWHKAIYFPYGLLFPLAMTGMIISWNRKSGLALLYIFILSYIPSVILFLVTARHRLAVIPFMLIFAAAGLWELYHYWKKKNWRSLGIYFASVLVLIFLCNRVYFDIGFRNISQIHFNLALSYERQGNLPMAEREYQAALQENPGSATTLNNLGYLQYRMGKLNVAGENFKRAIEVDPTFARAYNNMGLIFEAQGDYAQAEKYYEKALNLDPNLIQAYFNLGDIYIAQNDLLKAEIYYLQAKEISPSSKEPYFKLGALYARRQEFARAEEMFLKGEKLGAPGAYDYLNWGNIYYATRQPQRAIELYKRSVAADSSFGQAYINLARAFQTFGYPADSAKFYLRKILGINPQFAPAREALEQLKKN